MHHEYGTFNFYSAGKGRKEQKALLFLSSYLLSVRCRASCLYDMRDLISKGQEALGWRLESSNSNPSFKISVGSHVEEFIMNITFSQTNTQNTLLHRKYLTIISMLIIGCCRQHQSTEYWN